jgi:GT2 family glycosyltransferase
LSKVAIVILNYNGRDLLRNFLPSVIRFSTAAKIIVADNNSSDDSADVLRREFPMVDYIQIQENLGFCGGYNFALQKLEAEYYVLLNSDVEVTAGWLEPLVQLLDASPFIAAVQPKVLAYHRREYFEYAGAGGGFIDALGYPFCRGRIFNSIEMDTAQYNDTRPVFWATGACMVVRAKLFHTMGGFDEDFFAHMEEIDLCWKLHRAGHRVYYTGESVVYHVGGGTLPKSNATKTYLNFRNGLNLIYKHLRTEELFWKLPVRVLLDWVAAIRFFGSGLPKDALAVMKAHLHFIKGLSRSHKKRKALITLLGTFRTTEVYPRSIIADYFLFAKKNFRDLNF